MFPLLFSQLLFSCTMAEPIEDSAQMLEPEDVHLDVEEEPIPPMSVLGALPLSGEHAVFIETLAVDSGSSISLSGYQTLLQQDSGSWSVIDETDVNMMALGEYEFVDGLTLDENNMVLLVDGEVMLFSDGFLQRSPINDELPVPPEKLSGTMDSLWFWGAGRLFNIAGSTIAEVQTSSSDISQFIFGPLGTHALALPELQLIEKGETGFQGSDYRRDILPQSMVFDRTGTLWVSDGSPVLYQRNANRLWSGLELEEAILQLAGGEDSMDLWIQTESTTFHHRAGEFYQIVLPEGEWMDVDAYGRLLIRTESGIQRASIERTVVVAGIHPGSSLAGIQELIFLPMLEDSLVSLSVWIDQTALTLSDNKTLVDANDFSAGAHILRMVATGEEGISVTETPFIIGDLPDVSWGNDIEPLSQRHCNDCHGETSFLPLHTAEQWEESISLILSEVLSNEMPKGGPYLSAEEIQMIRGWKNGGFQ